MYAGLDAYNGGVGSVHMFDAISGVPYQLRTLVNYVTDTTQVDGTLSDGDGFCAPNGVCGLRDISMGYDRLKGLVHSFPVLNSSAYAHFDSAQNILARFTKFDMTTNYL